MKCEECLPQLEDYLYCLLNATADKHLAIHLGACDVCAGEYALLRREQEIYTRCELQAGPALWAGVRARIMQEKESRSGRFTLFPALWGGLSLNPVLTVAICCLVLVVLAGLLRYVQLRPVGERATTANPQDAQQFAPAQTKQNSNAAQIGDAVQRAEVLPDRLERNVTRGGLALRGGNLRGAGISAATRARKMEKAVPGPDAIAEHSPTLPASRTSASDLDADSARHIERAEMLLRSFKNGRLLPEANTLDLEYEKRLSKDLVAHNILLRHDAELSGNVTLARLLDRLEPFLLDIANLRDNSGWQEIRLVREGLAREQIIVALQAF